ncbi:MAG TPA: GNAT family N-acetyltransferase, partial [Deinococcales bacterium]|nr:GNAT family N-acetyltransferase [Deinococcales bacterium]
PEARRQGLVERLLLASLEHMRARGQVVSMLYPFKAAFYRRYGWEVVAFLDQAKLNAADLRAFARGRREANPLRRMADPRARWRELEPDYERYAAGFNGMVHRDEDRWTERLLAPGREAVAWPGHGYVVYSVKGAEAKVHELVALDLEAKREILAHLGQLDSMSPTVALDLVPGFDLHWLEGAPSPTVTRAPTFMARVVDLPALVPAYRFRPGGAESFDLRVTDDAAPWNAGDWTLSLDEDGRGRLQPAAASATPELTVPIQALSAALFGGAALERLAAAGRVEAAPEAAARLDARLDQRPPLCLDFF